MSLPLSRTYRPMEAMPESELPEGPNGITSPSGTGSAAWLFAMGRAWTWNRNRRSP